MGVDDGMARKESFDESNVLLRCSVADLVEGIVDAKDLVARLPKDSWKVAIVGARRIFEQVALHERPPRPVGVEIGLSIEGVAFEELDGGLARGDLS
jgi:hypothetical protein